MIKKWFFAFGMMNLLFALTVPAQVSDKGITVNTTQQVQNSSTIYALVVGISKYQNVPSLNFADVDAYNFYQYLTSPAGGNVDGEHIKLLLNENATAANIIGALDWLVGVAKEGENVIIYFSGHGDLETTTMDQLGFLLAYDAPKSCYMAGGTIGLIYLQSYLKTLTVRNKSKVLMISDACKSGKLAGGMEGAAKTALELQQQWSNEIKILSSQAGELSQEGKKWGNGAGVFSYYLVNGLKGLADMNLDKKVTLRELDNYLAENVIRETSNTQNPSIVGNQSTILAFVDSTTLANIEKTNQSGNPDEAQLAMKGFNANTPTLLDPGIKELYDKFQLCIKKDYLLEGPDSIGNAWDYYDNLLKLQGAESILSSVKGTLLAALQNKSQIAINCWVNREDIPDSALTTYPEYYELYYAMQLIDSTYVMYDNIRSRYLFWKSVYTQDPKEKRSLLQECLRLDTNATYAHGYLGFICYEFRDYRQAIDYYKKAIGLAPKWLYPIIGMGNVYKLLVKSDSAIYYYQYAAQIEPDYDLPYGNLALVYSSIGAYETAMQYIDKAIGLAPDRGLNYFTKASILTAQKKYDQALTVLQKGVEIEKQHETDESTYYNLGLAYRALNDYSNAAEAFKGAIALNKNNSIYYSELGYTNYSMKEYSLASLAYAQAIQLDPENGYYYIMRANCFSYMGMYAESLPWYEEGLQKDSLYAANWRMASRGYRFAGEYDKAIAASLMSLKLDSTDQWNYYFASLAYDYARDNKNAIYYAEKALSMNPTYADFEFNLADLYRLNNQNDEAILHFKNAIQLDPKVTKYYTNLAYTYESAGNNPQAEANYLKAIELDAKNSIRYVNLAQFYLDVTKDHAKAETYYNKAKEVNPDDYNIYSGLGFLFLRAGNNKKSKESFTRAIELAPDAAWNYYNMCCMYSLTGNPKKAVQYLKLALEKGMSDIEHIKKDPDLDPIRQEPGFKALMKEYFKLNL